MANGTAIAEVEPKTEKKAAVKIVETFENGVKLVEQEGKFEIPAEHPEAGTEKSFKYQYRVYPDMDTVADAKDAKGERLIPPKQVLKAVNKDLASRARSNAYQAAIMPYKPTEVSEEDIRERMVRDYIRLGKSEEKARELVALAFDTE